MRLIDIEPVLKVAELAGKEYVSIDFLKGFEQVDAVPVVRGEWKNVYKSGYKPNPENVCSECDCWSHRRSDYCPNCGARMDGES